MPHKEKQLEDLSRFIVTPPSWYVSVCLIILLGGAIEAMSALGGRAGTDTIDWFGIWGYLVPGVLAGFFTFGTVSVFRRGRAPGWPALIALGATVLSVFISLLPVPLALPVSFATMYALSLGFVFALRLLTLAAVADYRFSHIFVPALVQSGLGVIAGGVYFGSSFIGTALLLHLFLGGAVIVFVQIIERPLRAVYHLNLFALSNAFMAHLAEGSTRLDDFFASIGEEVEVFQTSLFFRRADGGPVCLTAPNLHPGPLGEIGSSNMPALLTASLPGETLVAHGCATHDFNLVSPDEVTRIAAAIEAGRERLAYDGTAGSSVRVRTGTVEVLVQPFGDTVVLVATRSPETTDDLEYAVGLAMMRGVPPPFRHVLFIDAHNCMYEVPPPVEIGSPLAREYLDAADAGMRAAAARAQAPFAIGTSRRPLPFTRRQGLGDLGLQVLVVRTGDQTTAYVLFDGNNVLNGVREVLREAALTLVDECEILTTDSHVVNTLSGRNPIGLAVPAPEILPHLRAAIEEALDTLAPAEAAGATAWIRGVRVFGYQRVSQLGGAASAILSMLVPVAVVLLALAFVMTLMAYLILA